MKTLDNILRKIYRRIICQDPIKDHIKRGLVVGDNFNMFDGVIIDCSHTWHIEIGNSVTLAPRVHIISHDASTKMHLNFTRIGNVKIGDRVFIGASAIVLPGVTIGNDVIVGAGSVVSRDVQDGHVVAGNPAKFICTIEDYISKKRNEINKCPCFGEEFTINHNVTDDMKSEMNSRMKDKIGYII